uniref:Uncharacterized protein n=1 Tax=Anguilla anguilla TaxID=7936 RepID=A0A0E9Q275_ANGAN
MHAVRRSLSFPCGWLPLLFFWLLCSVLESLFTVWLSNTPQEVTLLPCTAKTSSVSTTQTSLHLSSWLLMSPTRSVPRIPS